MNYNLAESMFSTTVLSDQLYSNNMQNTHISIFKSGASYGKISGGIFVRFTTGRTEPVGATRRRQNFSLNLL